MQLNIRSSSIKPMLDIIQRIKNKENVCDDLDIVLEHEDYDFEFKRYSKSIEKEEFKHYLLNFLTLEEKDIKNQNFRIHHQYYKDVFNNLDYYYNKLNEFNQMFNIEVLKKSLQITKNGLPDDFIVPQIDFVFTLGIGMSFGYVFGNASHYDFLKLSKEVSFNEFLSTLSHEVHHVCMNHIFPDNLTPLELFIIFFSGEGLAVKYCNNAEGVISKKIYDKEPNIGLDQFSWDYLNNRFETAFTYFKNTIAEIQSGSIDSSDKVKEVVSKYFMNPYTEDQNKDESPKLHQLLLYSLGNDLFGVIHDVFGKQKVFEVVRNPNMFIQTFNQAVTEIGRKDLLI